MKEYSIVVVLWDDHYSASRQPLPKDPDNFLSPVLSVGIIVKETKKVLVLVHDIERWDDQDDLSYTVILKSTIVGRKEYGRIKLKKPRG